MTAPVLLQPPLVAALLLALAFAGDRLLPGPRLPALPAAGWATLVAGLALVAWARIHFMRRRTTLFVGRRPAVLVTDGPFSLSRNPMYLGMTISALGLALLARHWAWFAAPPLFVLVVALRHIPAEEQSLRAAFGPAFNRYAGRVRRWL